MYLSRVRVGLRELLAERGAKGEPDHYSVHQLVWRWFGDHPDRERDFLYRWELTPHELVVYTLGRREPGPPRTWRCETRPFEPKLREGAPYRFSLRANPTRRAGPTEAGRRAARVDVVMHARKLAAAEGRDERPIFEAGRAWLARQGERAGFSLTNDLLVGGYQQLSFRRRKGGSPIQVSQLDFDGVLIVQDPERLVERLAHGFGSAKAFGFGLMMLKPAR